MANKATWENLLANLNTLPNVVNHPEWEEAYDAWVSNTDFPFRIKDVGDDVALAYILAKNTFSVNESGQIQCENSEFSSVWVWDTQNGRWTFVDD